MPTATAPASSRTRLPARVVLAAALLAEAAVLAYGLHHQFTARILWTESITIVLFLIALAALAASAIPVRTALIGIAVAGLGFQLIGLSSGLTSSDDAYRYGWDAKVQLAGIDPYRYTPDAHALDRLRTTTLFPDRSRCAWHLSDGHCSLINRPSVHTIYPPVAEAAFTFSRLASFGSTDGPFPLQALGALGATLIGLLLSRWARRDGRAPWTVAVWSWCPVTVMEIANNAHIDWLAVLFSLVGLVALRRGRPAWAGGLIGAAIATKLYPGLLLVSMLRRHPVRLVGAAIGVVALSYVPHVLAVGTKVIGFLPGYLKEEKYTSGGRFMLLDVVLPKFLLSPAAAVILLAVAYWAWRRSDPDRPELTGVVVVGVTLMVTTPGYAWYALLLLGLVALTGRLEWLSMAIAPTISMLGGPEVGNGVVFRTCAFAVGAAITGGWLLVRQRRKALAPVPH